MDQSNPFELISDDDFDTSEQITLNKELIRIIEKDVDDLKGNRSG